MSKAYQVVGKNGEHVTYVAHETKTMAYEHMVFLKQRHPEREYKVIEIEL